MITFEQVSKLYGERLALDAVSWHMNEGECVVFLGPSGAGKTTILRLITHETQPNSGSVTVGTFQGGHLRRAHRALLRRTLGIVYEDFRLLDDRTVFENVALPVRVAGLFADWEVVPRVLHALDAVGLQPKQKSFPAELSAGEKQRVAIARAIVNRPAVILADEPTGALEKKSAEEVLALLKRIHGEGAALLLVTTRHEVADALPARVLQLDDGRLTGGDPGTPLTPAPWEEGPWAIVTPAAGTEASEPGGSVEAGGGAETVAQPGGEAGSSTEGGNGAEASGQPGESAEPAVSAEPSTSTESAQAEALAIEPSATAGGEPDDRQGPPERV